jgi:paraquat-inducible protein B
VASVDISFDREQGRFVFPVKLAIYRDIAATVPARDAGTASQRSEGRRFPMERLLSTRSVERGLRAQLRSANLLTGQRYVAIDFFPEQRAAKIAKLDDGAREIPTVPDAFGELQAQVARIAKRLEEVPFEQLAGDLKRTLNKIDGAATSVEKTMGGLSAELVPSARQAIDEARGAIKDVRGLLAEDAPLPQDLRGALQDLSRAADAIRQLADTIERQPESLLRGKRSDPPALEPKK